MDVQLLIAASAMLTLMVLLPGPDWAFLIAAGTTGRSILPSLTGILAGYLVVVGAVVVGVGAAVAAVPWFVVVLTLASAGYLLHLGVNVLRNPPRLAGAHGGSGTVNDSHETSTASWRRFGQGAGVSGLNPKGLLVLVVLLPQFTDAAGAWPLPVQLAVLGLVYLAACAVVYSFVGFGARAVIRLRPSAMTWVSRVSGAAMIVLALVLVGEQVVHLAAPA